MATVVVRGVNLNDTIRLPNPEHRGVGEKARNCLLQGPSFAALNFP